MDVVHHAPCLLPAHVAHQVGNARLAVPSGTNGNRLHHHSHRALHALAVATVKNGGETHLILARETAQENGEGGETHDVGTLSCPVADVVPLLRSYVGVEYLELRHRLACVMSVGWRHAAECRSGESGFVPQSCCIVVGCLPSLAFFAGNIEEVVGLGLHRHPFVCVGDVAEQYVH